MSADELKNMLAREAESMTPIERLEFIARLRRLASPPPPAAAVWLDRRLGPVATAGDVRIWLN